MRIESIKMVKIPVGLRFRVVYADPRMLSRILSACDVDGDDLVSRGFDLGAGVVIEAGPERLSLICAGVMRGSFRVVEEEAKEEPKEEAKEEPKKPARKGRRR